MKKIITSITSLSLFWGSVYSQTMFVGGNTDGADYNGNIVSNVSGEYASIVGGNQRSNAETGNVNGDITLNLDGINVAGSGFVSGGNLLNYLGSDTTAENPSKALGYVSGTVTINFDSGIISATQGLRGGNTGGISGQENDKVGAVVINLNGGDVSSYVLGSGGAFSDVEKDVTINVNAGSIGGIYSVGGGDATVGGDVNVNVSGGTVSTIYGGGAKDALVKGNVNIILSEDANVSGNVYLGAWNGNGIIDGKATFVAKDNAKVSGNVYGGGEFGVINSGTSVKIESGASVNSVYGGGAKDALVKGGTNVEVYGKASSVVGGGYQSDVEGGTNVIVDSADANLSHIVGAGYQGGNVTGDVNVTLKNGTVSDMFVGGSREGGNVDGNIKIDMTGGAINTYLVGGNYQSQDSLIKGNIDISITGGSVSHGVRGGSMGSAGTIMETDGNVTIYVGGDAYIGKSGGEAISSAGSYATVKDVTITVADNAVVDSTIYGGGGRTLTDSNRNNASDLSYDEIKYSAENVKINIEGGTVNGDIYGGALKYSGVKSSEINVSAGTVNGNLYGAGGEDGSGKFTLLEDSAKINLSGGEIKGNVYGSGSNSTALVKGDVSIIVSNDVQIDGTIYGTANGSVVAGTKNLSIESFKGSALKADSFDNVNISSDSIVDISLANISKLSIENGAKVSLASESEFEKLLIRFDDEIFALDDTVDISEIFGDSASVVLSEIENGSSFTILDANQNLFTVGLAGATLSITSEIPEPSTYAAILGALALAFAAYRRKK